MLGLLTTLAVSDNPRISFYLVVMGIGFLIGVFGHLIKSTPVILLGILMMFVTSALLTGNVFSG
ncbi:MAG TPA: hypothetical protein VLJ42_12455 [Solirubrobacteraceae bacterium]|nr:hypothetical protein [Solirubrobacteraceae bacterium]